MGAGLTLVLAEEAAAKPRRGQLQWQLRLTCSFAAYAWHVVRIGLLALAASSAQPSLCAGVSRLRRLGGFGVLCRRRLQLARRACSTLVLSVLA